MELQEQIQKLLNERPDQADSPADKAKADTGKTEECKRKNCQALRDSILNTCASLSGEKRRACIAAAEISYQQCMED